MVDRDDIKVVDWIIDGVRARVTVRYCEDKLTVCVGTFIVLKVFVTSVGFVHSRINLKKQKQRRKKDT